MWTTKLVVGLAIVSAMAMSAPPAAGTIVWANDAVGGGSTIRAFDSTTGALVESFLAPNPAAQGHTGRGIAVVGSNIYYSGDDSGSVFLTNPSGIDLGAAFATGLTGIGSITPDGSFLYLTATSDATTSENVYQYTFAGVPVNTLTLVPTAPGAPFVLGRTGLETVAGEFVVNQGNNEGPYNRFDSLGNLIPPSIFLQNTDDFGFSGVAFDGTFFYVANAEDTPSTLRIYGAAGNFLNAVTLTGCPGPNDLCDLQDLSVAVVSEPRSIGWLAIALMVCAFCLAGCKPAALEK